VTNKRKRRYRIRNWQQYNKALISPGNLALRVETKSLDIWLNTEHAARRSRQHLYADVAIVCALTLREVYHLPLRATEGLARSLMRLLALDSPIPHYSTLSRRARTLSLSLAQNRNIKHLVIDSTGLKLYGEGEWKVRQRVWTKHRTWRKLHLSIAADSHHVASVFITPQDVVDPRVLPRLLKAVEAPIENVLADGAYDSRERYKAI
jgi:hypothetical protein